MVPTITKTDIGIMIGIIGGLMLSERFVKPTVKGVL